MNTKSALILVTLTLAVVAGSANARRLTPDVAVQWSGPSELQLGRAEHYRLGVSNVGFAAAYNVLATLSLPSGVTVENKPAECVQQGQQVKCNHSVIAVGETKTATIDLRAPTSGTTQAQLTFTASASGDNRQANNSATVRTMFAEFQPSIVFPATAPVWICMGRHNLPDCPLTSPEDIFQLDASGKHFDYSGYRAAATVPGPNLLNFALFDPNNVQVSSWVLTPFSSRCNQGQAHYPMLNDTDEVRVCY